MLHRAYLLAGWPAPPTVCTILGVGGWVACGPAARTTDLGDWRIPISATAERPIENDEGELRCYRHPNNPTRLRCNRCGKPICTRCANATPVGLRCPDCARGPRPVIYQTDPAILVRAVGGGVVAALVIGIAWGLLNTAGLGRYGLAYNWGFWFSLLLGFGVAESISFLAKRRRGTTLQAVGIGCVLLGFAISRVVISARLALSISLDQALLGTPALGIDLLALLFLALACAIAWRRFR